MLESDEGFKVKGLRKSFKPKKCQKCLHLKPALTEGAASE